MSSTHLVFLSIWIAKILSLTIFMPLVMRILKWRRWKSEVTMSRETYHGYNLTCLLNIPGPPISKALLSTWKELSQYCLTSRSTSTLLTRMSKFGCLLRCTNFTNSISYKKHNATHLSKMLSGRFYFVNATPAVLSLQR